MFSIYLDTLLLNLKRKGVGCSWGGEFIGALAYADDVVLLAPSLSALRLMLKECELYASAHGLQFNPSKTQFIQFCHHSPLRTDPSVIFCGCRLPLLKEVLHLGHILTYNLSDDRDIQSKTRDMIRKVNSLFYCFPNLSPTVMTFLFRSYCLSLYGSALWNLSSKSLKALEISYNKILRRIWKLPYSSHTRIVHCTAKLLSLFNSTLKRIFALFSTSQKCSSNLVRYVFNKSASCSFTFLGYNLKHGHQFCKSYSGRDQFCADVIRDIRSAQSFLSLSNTLLDSVVCSLSTYSF